MPSGSRGISRWFRLTMCTCSRDFRCLVPHRHGSSWLRFLAQRIWSVSATTSSGWRHPRATLQELKFAVGSRHARPGVAMLAEILPILTARADSPPESRIRYRFLLAGLPTVAVNEEIYDAQGMFIALPDLAFRRYRMVIDYEGDHHRTDRVQWQKDIARVPRLEAANWHSTRVSAQDLRDSRELICRIRRLLRERGWIG